MRRIYRFAALLLAAVCFAAILTGCHGSKERIAFTTPEAFDTETPVTITFWAKNDTNMTQVAIYHKAIEDFQKLYPNVTVDLRLYTDYGKIYNDVITNLATDTTPNVCITYPDHIATYLTGQNVVVPLDDLMADARYGLGGSELRFDGPTRDEMVPAFLDECAFKGYYYAMPYMRSTEACYVNKTYVEKLGYTLPETLTWDFVWEVSEAAMAKDADGNFTVNGQSVMIPFIYKSTDNMMIQMLAQKNAGYSTETGEIEMFNDTAREILDTVASHVKNGAFSTFKISSYPANFLNAGQCIFAIDSTAGATWMGSDAPLLDIPPEQIVDFETVVTEIPQFDPADPKMISQGPSVCVFNKEDPQIVLASWLFVQYLLTNDVQMAYAETEGYVPVTLKAQQSPEYLDYLAREGEPSPDGKYYDIKIKASKLLIEHTDDTFTTPVFNGSASLRDAAGQLIENTTKGVRRKQIDRVDEAQFEQMTDDVVSLYRLDQIEGGQGSGGREELGKMPATSKALLITLPVIWVILGVCALTGLIHRKKAEKTGDA